MRRVSAEIQIARGLGEPTWVARSRVVLSDFSAHGVAMFTSQRFQEYQQVAVSIDLPRQFFCRGRVRWCHDAPTGRIITAEGNPEFKYRVSIEFMFDSAEERTQVLEYCKDLARQQMLVLSRPDLKL